MQASTIQQDGSWFCPRRAVRKCGVHRNVVPWCALMHMDRYGRVQVWKAPMRSNEHMQTAPKISTIFDHLKTKICKMYCKTVRRWENSWLQFRWLMRPTDQLFVSQFPQRTKKSRKNTCMMWGAVYQQRSAKTRYITWLGQDRKFCTFQDLEYAKGVH